MNSTRRNSNIKLPFTRLPQLLLTILTVLCIGSMGYYYFQKENIVSISQVAGIVTVPVQNGINKAGEFLFRLDQKHLAIEDARASIASLEAENAELKEKMVSYDQKIRDYQDMSKLLELKNTYSDYDTVGASIVFADTGGNWFSTFTIDKGSDDGLSEGMNVIADGGLVGYISETSPGHSIVTTIINDNINVSAEQMSTGDACVVMGDLISMKQDGLLPLKYMDVDFDISSDQVIVTSKISDKYLPGIVIGYASDVYIENNGVEAAGYLKPAVDFQHISNVLVITTKKEI